MKTTKIVKSFSNNVNEFERKVPASLLWIQLNGNRETPDVSFCFEVLLLGFCRVIVMNDGTGFLPGGLLGEKISLIT